MPTNDDFNAWICAVATNGDREAFAALFRHFAPRIKGYLVRSGVRTQVAEDLAQEAMVILWRRAATFDPRRAALSTWLFTITRNLRIDHYRRATQDAAEARVDHDIDVWDVDQETADVRAGPDELALTAQRERSVHLALAELRPEHALLLQLSFFEERPHATIARELGIPLGTVKSRIRLAIAQLRRKLDQCGP
ncbi:sigma-70 family RNA polymerase sigma factor [Ramlibacter henchirensis]|uniref:Sigma-70 family RNA polymerase sigma factor n=2 Tax=Ramlibacter henchirensis TaxID=204072 RepID=A0A4Z0BSP7_9BURK|nr:sigma-70 family RNA polymerase sigma factor [Ramlibacter henchirensis]